MDVTTSEDIEYGLLKSCWICSGDGKSRFRHSSGREGSDKPCTWCFDCIGTGKDVFGNYCGENYMSLRDKANRYQAIGKPLP